MCATTSLYILKQNHSCLFTTVATVNVGFIPIFGKLTLFCRNRSFRGGEIVWISKNLRRISLVSPTLFFAVLFVSQLSRFFYKAVTICLFVFINASNQYLLKFWLAIRDQKVKISPRKTPVSPSRIYHSPSLHFIMHQIWNRQSNIWKRDRY